ncbi:hypothetical protein JCM11641_003034 [Rhodosporidiobolus odoratus]
MLPFGRPAAFYLIPSTPETVTYDAGLSPRHTLNVHDVDGEGREWRVQCSVAKVSIYNAKNLTLYLPGRIVTSTIEVFNSEDINLVIGPSSSPASPDDLSPLGVLQLDPSLRNVSVLYTQPEAVGKVVIAPLPSLGANSRPTFGFSSLTLRAGSGEAFPVFDGEGNLQSPEAEEPPTSPAHPTDDLARQLVVSLENGSWRLKGLTRGEKDYPQLS